MNIEIRSRGINDCEGLERSRVCTRQSEDLWQVLISNKLQMSIPINLRRPREPFPSITVPVSSLGSSSYATGNSTDDTLTASCIYTLCCSSFLLYYGTPIPINLGIQERTHLHIPILSTVTISTSGQGLFLPPHSCVAHLSFRQHFQ